MLDVNARFIAGLFLLGIATAGCSLLNDADTDPTPYDYVALDSTGTTMVEGTLLLNIENQGEDGEREITGSWETRKLTDSVRVGPQVGKGKIKGEIRKNGDLSIDMNPEKEGVFWTKVFLKSEKSESVLNLRGQWFIVTRKGTGPTVGRVGGQFEATRQ